MEDAWHADLERLILPFCNTQSMSLHLAEIALAVAPGAPLWC